MSKKAKKQTNHNLIHRLTKAHEWLAFEGDRFKHITILLECASRVIKEQEDIIRNLKLNNKGY